MFALIDGPFVAHCTHRILFNGPPRMANEEDTKNTTRLSAAAAEGIVVLMQMDAIDILQGWCFHAASIDVSLFAPSPSSAIPRYISPSWSASNHLQLLPRAVHQLTHCKKMAGKMPNPAILFQFSRYLRFLPHSESRVHLTEPAQSG